MGGDQAGPYFEVDAYISNPPNHSGPQCCDSTNISNPLFGNSRTASWDVRTIQLRVRLGF